MVAALSTAVTFGGFFRGSSRLSAAHIMRITDGSISGRIREGFLGVKTGLQFNHEGAEGKCMLEREPIKLKVRTGK
jgi:hypothetical protein